MSRAKLTEDELREKRREWQRAYYERNPERAKASSRAYYQRNRAEILGKAKERNREWRATPEGKALKREQGLRRYYRDVEKTRERQRQAYKRRRAAKFGITVEEWDAILARGCAICGAHPSGRYLHLDHDHASGKVRDALCHGCNTGLGSFGDDPVRLRAAARYIESHQKT